MLPRGSNKGIEGTITVINKHDVGTKSNYYILTNRIFGQTYSTCQERLMRSKMHFWKPQRKNGTKCKCNSSSLEA